MRLSVCVRVWDDFHLQHRLREDLHDCRVFTYERTRGMYHAVQFPTLTILADLLMLRVIPGLLCIIVCYDTVGLNTGEGKRATFYASFSMINMTAALFARFIFYLSVSFIHNMAPMQAAINTMSLYALFVLHAGYLLNEQQLNPIHDVVKRWSFFYWVR
jgi:hypothetical protein